MSLGNSTTIDAEDYEYDGETSMICISDSFSNVTGSTFYSDEYSKIRDNILYEITTSSDTDNLLVKACKIRLYNALKNGELYLKLQNNEIIGKSIDDYTVDETEISKTVSETDSNGETTETTYSYEYINPNDIFLFLKKYYIPLDYRFQSLDSFDETYMKKHELSENTMKQIKALSLYLRRKDYFSENTDTEE